jgi:hypothetical protein
MTHALSISTSFIKLSKTFISLRKAKKILKRHLKTLRKEKQTLKGTTMMKVSDYNKNPKLKKSNKKVIRTKTQIKLR